MKALRQCGLKVGWIVGGLMLALAASALENATVAPLDAGSAPTPPRPPSITEGFSPGIADIVKMVDAKVDVEVIKAYIKSSSVPYNPRAEDIIALKQRGIPDDILRLMLQRDGDVRTQLAQGAPGNAAVAPAPVYSTPPGVYQTPYANDYGQYAAPYADYASGYPYYSYPYNYSYWYGYGYPWGFYWPFYFGAGYGYCGYHHAWHNCGYNYYGHGGYYNHSGYHGHGGYYNHAGYYNRAAAVNRGQPYRPVAVASRSFSPARTGGTYAAVGNFGRAPVSFANRTAAFHPASSGSFRGFGGGGFHSGGGGSHGGGHR